MADEVRGDPVSRRTVLKGMAGVAGLLSVPAIAAACSTTSGSSAPSAAGTSATSAAPAGSGSAAPAGSTAVGQVSIGSYHTDPGEPEGQKAVDAAFTQATGIAVKENIVDHTTFQNQITNYLGGTPDTAYTWFSGFRMKFFADKGLTIPIDDLWAKVKDNFAEGFQQAVVGNDGKVYGIPVDYYPWAVFYRKSVFADKGYKVPTTWDELKTLSQTMQKDGLTPIAFADQEGWPAMGTFDILNLRLNGYDFHVGLMAGEQKWTDPKVTAVFQKWAEIVPYHSKNYAGMKWTDAATSLLKKESGMFLLGLFMSSVFSATKNPDDINDLDFFPYPNLGTQYDAEAAIDAPIDTWQIAAKSPNLDQEKDAALAYLEFWAKGSTQGIFFEHQPGFIPTAKDADTSKYSALQKKAVEVVGNAKRITQFLDRDTRSDFAGAQGMQLFLQKFLANPSQDLAAFQKTIQDYWDALPPVT
jgi:multiple sugar transport system substrate-binding protein